MKLILFITAAICFSMQLTAQDTTAVLINNQKIIQAVIKQDQTAVLLPVKKKDYKKAGSFIIIVNGEHVTGDLYKRSLEVSHNTISIIEETKNKPGYFDMSKKQLPAGKTIVLTLIMEPSNPRMRIPSKRIYLGNLVVK